MRFQRNLFLKLTTPKACTLTLGTLGTLGTLAHFLLNMAKNFCQKKHEFQN